MNQTFEDMKEIVRKNPFAQHIGMELLEVTEGYALGRIRLAKQYENIYGGMHGGCAYSLADTLSGIAACVDELSASGGTYRVCLLQSEGAAPRKEDHGCPGRTVKR